MALNPVSPSAIAHTTEPSASPPGTDPVIATPTGSASTTSPTVASTEKMPTVRRPSDRSSRTVGQSSSPAAWLIRVNSAVTSETATSEWGSMNSRKA